MNSVTNHLTSERFRPTAPVLEGNACLEGVGPHFGTLGQTSQELPHHSAFISGECELGGKTDQPFCPVGDVRPALGELRQLEARAECRHGKSVLR